MTRAGFLDTGVVVGYCVTVDRHHGPCSEYIENHSLLFTSDTVEEEYRSTKPDVCTRYADAVRMHLSDVKRSDLDGQLDPVDLDRLKTEILDRRNRLHGVLYDFYEGLDQFVHYDAVIAELEALARDIEAMAAQRKANLDEQVDTWDRKDEHRNVRKELDLHEPDLTICVDGHDLAVHLSDETELATANPRDFVREGMREQILDLTAYVDVVDLTA